MEKQGKFKPSNETIHFRNWVLWEKCGESTCRVYALLHHRDNPRCEAVQRLCSEALDWCCWHASCHFQLESHELYKTTPYNNSQASCWNKEQAAIAVDRTDDCGIDASKIGQLISVASKYITHQYWVSQFSSPKYPNMEWGNQRQDRLGTKQNSKDGKNAA